MKWCFIIIFWGQTALVNAQITYTEHIAPILNEKCAPCHQKGDIGPMPLTTYEDVASYATMIGYVIDSKLMPPFKADESNVTYKNSRFITSEEKDLIHEWIDQGIIKGKKNTYPETYAKVEETPHPDTIICMSEAFDHYGIYYDQYQVFSLPIDLKKDRYVRNINIKPGNKKIVRSVQLEVAPLHSSKIIDEWDPRYGYFAYGNTNVLASHPNWYSWMPNTDALQLNQSENLFLPKQSEILMHIHYGPFGEEQSDSTCIQLVFDTTYTDSHTLQSVPLFHTDFLTDTFQIEPNIKKRISSSFIIPTETLLRSITPISHLLCRSWEIYAVYPDGSSRHLLKINDWDFHWKEKYVFEHPILLPKGTKIYGTAIYDNTVDNLYNPADPPHLMKSGPHMYDENFLCYFEFLDSVNKSYFHKRFSVIEKSIQELSLHVEQSKTYTIKIEELTSGKTIFSSTKNLNKGNHKIKSSQLPYTPGRYAASIASNGLVYDTWWFTVH